MHPLEGSPSHVTIGIEYISVTYHADVLDDWNKSTDEKNIYATNLIQKEEDDVFFYQDMLANPNKQTNIVRQGLGKIRLRL